MKRNIKIQIMTSLPIINLQRRIICQQASFPGKKGIGKRQRHFQSKTDPVLLYPKEENKEYHQFARPVS